MTDNNQQEGYRKAIHNIIDEFFEPDQKEKHTSELEETIWRLFQRHESAAEEKGRREEREKRIEFAERLKLEVDTIVCDCGEEPKDWDIADLINDELEKLSNNKTE